jgi:stress response protein YsnF
VSAVGSGARPEDRAEVVRSEERLDVTTRRVPFARAVLRKVIVVEQRTITVDVAHEEARLEILPIGEEWTDESRGVHVALPDLVLSEEQVVVTKRVVPVERVRMRVEEVVMDASVTGDVRREQVDVVDVRAST